MLVSEAFLAGVDRGVGPGWTSSDDLFFLFSVPTAFDQLEIEGAFLLYALITLC
jgi:hypothetical protein